jgi:Fe-S-cluster-containing dehydrogenase component
MNMEHLGIENKPGGCRVCVCEVQGRRNLVPACVTECTEGMEVKTHSLRVLNSRRTVVELLLSDHPKDCLTCLKSGRCELQSLANMMGIREIHCEATAAMSTYRKDASPAIIRDMDKCVMCRSCETVCNDVQTVGALSAVNRGFMAVVAPAFEQELTDSPCTFCGQCVAVCPTGALTEVDHTPRLSVPWQILPKRWWYRPLRPYAPFWVKNSVIPQALRNRKDGCCPSCPRIRQGIRLPTLLRTSPSWKKAPNARPYKPSPPGRQERKITYSYFMLPCMGELL